MIFYPLLNRKGFKIHQILFFMLNIIFQVSTKKNEITIQGIGQHIAMRVNDTRSMNKASLTSYNTISVKFFSQKTDMIFNKSREVSKENYFHGVGSAGSTINLVEEYDSKSGEKFTIGSIVDYKTKLIHQIRRDNDGGTLVFSRRASEFPESAEAIQAPKDDEEVKIMQYKNSTYEPSVTNNGKIIDIMVLWTKKSECENSNLSSSCSINSNTVRNMRALVSLAIQETNTAFRLSGIDTQLRLVHAYRDNFYKETTIADALQHVTQTTDGKLNDVHSKRERYGADMVAFLTSTDDGYCGRAYIGPSIRYMFSVTEWNCATGSFVFAHEIGHNLGCNHDRGTDDSCSSPGYNFGYRDPSAEFRSLMAYSCVSGQCDGNAGTFCPRAQMFSNVVKKQNSKKIGDDRNNCARQINEVRVLVSSYYTSNVAPTPKPITIPTAKPKIPNKEKKKLKKQKKKLKKQKKKLKKQKKKLKKQKKKLKKKKKKKKKKKLQKKQKKTTPPTFLPTVSPTAPPTFIPSLRPSLTPTLVSSALLSQFNSESSSTSATISGSFSLLQMTNK